MTRAEVAAQLKRLRALTRGAPVDKESATIVLDEWEKRFADKDAGEVERIIDNYLSDPEKGKWFPTIAEILPLSRIPSASNSTKGDGEVPKDGWAGKGTVGAFLAVVSIIHQMTHDGVMYDGEPLVYNWDSCPPMGFGEWERAGCPATWSRLYDTFAHGCLQVIKQQGSVDSFVKQFGEHLQNMKRGKAL